MNKAILIGRLVRDVEIKTISTTGSAVVNNAIAVTRYRNSNNGERVEETLFLDVVFYGRLAEIVGQYLRKGSKLAVEGYLQLQTWVDTQTNQNRSRVQLVVENMEMLDSKGDQGSNQNTNYQPSQKTPAYQNNSQYEREQSNSFNKQNDFVEQRNNYKQDYADDAEIPF